jgi:L-lactate utilization protein LutB
MEEIGFSEKLEKLQATAFEPDLVEFLTTVRSI